MKNWIVSFVVCIAASLVNAAPIKSMLGVKASCMDNGNGLPYDAEVEYIKSTGQQWIETGIYGSMDLDFIVDFTPTEMSSSTASGMGSIFASRENSGRRAYQLTTYNRDSTLSGHFLCSANYGWSDARVPNAAMTVGVRCTISKEGLVFTKADGTTYELTSQTFTTPWTISLFAMKTLGDRTIFEYSKIFLYSCRFSRNGVVLRDFIPVRFRNEKGVQEGALYDRADPTGGVEGNGLYRNQGKGSFVIGPDK